MGEAQIYLNWMATSGGNIPYNAVVGGFDNASKEPLYIGRAQYGGGFVPGKVVRSHNCLYIPYGGQEISISNYDILVSDKPNVLSWQKPTSGGGLPDCAVQGGHENSGEPYYIARAFSPDDGQCVGKFHPSHQCCYIPWGGKEIASQNYEILTFP